MTRNLDKAAADFEKMMRKELGAAAPLPWHVEEVQPGTMASGLGEFLKVFGGSMQIKARLTYDLPAPHPAQLYVGVIQPGINTFPATLLFVGKLGKPVAGKAAFVQSTAGAGMFQGEAQLCARLNGTKDVLGLAASVFRGKVTVNRVVVDITPAVEVMGDGATAELRVRKVLLLKGLLGSLLFQVRELLELRTAVEGVL